MKTCLEVTPEGAGVCFFLRSCSAISTHANSGTVMTTHIGGAFVGISIQILPHSGVVGAPRVTPGVSRMGRRRLWRSLGLPPLRLPWSTRRRHYTTEQILQLAQVHIGCCSCCARSTVRRVRSGRSVRRRCWCCCWWRRRR